MVQMYVVGSKDVVVADGGVQKIFKLIRSRLANATLPVLIQGETGSGKEIVAAAVHEWSRRHTGPFVAVNCAALPDNLIESALFGHCRGAFTGADIDQQGLVRAASGGTLFLDEVGEMSEQAQAKLLRFLETKRVRPVGEHSEIPVDVRVVAATNRSLRAEVKQGRFRKDLFFRLRGATIKIPPLRERPSDIDALAEKFLFDACTRAGTPMKKPTRGFIAELHEHAWPGNVRELETAMNYLGVVIDDPELTAEHFRSWCDATVDLMFDSLMTGAGGHQTADIVSFKPIADELADLERDRMRRALIATDGRRNEAAALISMPLRTFTTKLKQYELDRMTFSLDRKHV